MDNLTQNPAQLITRSTSSANGYLKINFPVVLGLVNVQVQQKINNSILALVNKLVIDQGFYSDKMVTMQGWYEIKSNERGILSLVISNYAYHYHAAHGMNVNKSLTFNINTGVQYQLADLFKQDSSYVKVLSDIVAAQIKARKVDILGEFTEISPDQDYYIADKCLVLYYQLYELAPYAYGFPYFPVSVYEIEGIIKEDGPLGKMAVNA